jgi:hypothetical protein
LVPQNSSLDIQDQLQVISTVEYELAYYKKVKIPTNSQNYKDQLLFWNDLKFVLPKLSAYAFYVLTAQASEAESERLFSLARRVLLPGRAGSLCFPCFT